jgi:hypothetical protein
MEATTQPDLFQPSRDGQSLGGGPAEPPSCQGTPVGRTVWYDLHPAFAGGVDVAASAAFPPTVAVFEYDRATARITRPLGCTAQPGGHVRLDLRAGRDYTIQLGGANGAGGPISLTVDYFRDRDGDGELDLLDDCPTVPGIHAAGGCPPRLDLAPSVLYRLTGAGIVIQRLVVDRVPRGARVLARCDGCPPTAVKAHRPGRVALKRLVGRAVRAGGRLEVRITLKPTGRGKYRFGATGTDFVWPVHADGLGTRRTRCLGAKTGAVQPCR